MKKLFLLVFFPLASFGQDYNYEALYLPKNDGKISYTEVVNAPGVKKGDLFKNSKIWFLDNFKSAEDVINFEDEQAGIVAGRGIITLVTKSMGYAIERTLWFSVRIEVKDDRFRYQIDEIEISGLGAEKRPIEVEFSREYMFNKKGKPQQNSWDWYALYEKEIISIEQALKSQIPKKKDDW